MPPGSGIAYLLATKGSDMRPTPAGLPARLAVMFALLLTLPALAAAVRPAHLALSKSDPADGTTLHALTEIRLWFSAEPMDMGASSVTVRILGADGKVLATGNAVRDPNDAKVYALGLPRGLPPASYKIAWQAMAVDGDAARGEFGFTVAAH